MNPFHHQKHFKRFLNIFLFSSFLFLFKSCFFYKKVSIYDFPAYETPPNGVKISDNLFYDETEISNLNWSEYAYWIKRECGENSIEYQSTLIKPDVWISYDSSLSSFDTFYLTHPAYWYSPVVGITQEQAKALTKWRTDVVFFRMLKENGIIPQDTSLYFDKMFTLEKYFRGEFNNFKPDFNVKYYLEFRLPTIEERKIALHYSDSVLEKYCKRCFSLKCIRVKKQLKRDGIYLRERTEGDLLFEPIEWGDDFNIPTKICDLDHIRGNASEWLAEENICAGGSWIDSKERILKSDTFHVNGPKVWVGFRNVAEWKSVDSLLIELGIERK